MSSCPVIMLAANVPEVGGVPVNPKDLSAENAPSMPPNLHVSG